MADAGARTAQIVERCNQLVGLTERAWELTATGDFMGLAEIIDQRDMIIEEIRAAGNMDAIPWPHRLEARAALVTVSELDDRIKQAVLSQMKSDLQTITDVSTRAKALSAYDPLLVKSRRFDRHH